MEATIFYPNQRPVYEVLDYDDLIEDVLSGEDLKNHLEAYEMVEDIAGKDIVRIYGTDDNGQEISIDVRSDNPDDLEQLEAHLIDVINSVEQEYEPVYEEEY